MDSTEAQTWAEIARLNTEARRALDAAWPLIHRLQAAHDTSTAPAPSTGKAARAMGMPDEHIQRARHAARTTADDFPTCLEREWQRWRREPTVYATWPRGRCVETVPVLATGPGAARVAGAAAWGTLP